MWLEVEEVVGEEGVVRYNGGESCVFGRGFEMLEEIKAIVRQAGEILLGAKIQAEGILAKEGHKNFVTRFDRQVQDFLEAEFQARWPEYLFIAEEQEDPALAKVGLRFIVDPIDGTSNFIYGLNLSAISVAAALDDKVTLGVVYNPFADEMFWAEEGKGAFLNGERLTCPDLPLELGLFCVGMSPYYEELMPKTLKLMGELQPLVVDLRRLGAAALDLSYIAAGRQGGFCEFRLQPWDFAAGMLIAQEAGAVVTQLTGEPLELDKPSTILCAGPRAYQEFREKVDLSFVKG